MKHRKSFLVTLPMALAVLCLQATAAGQTANESKLANMTGAGSSIRLDVLVANSGSTLTISSPDGRTFRKDYKAGVTPEFSIIDKAGERLPDGTYTYELRVVPAAGVLEKLRASRRGDDDSETDRTSRKGPNLPNLVQSGSFAIANGSVIVAGAIEDPRRTASTVSPQRMRELTVANTLARLRNHRTFVRPDDVIADDLIVQGSACVGLDCVSGEVFGFDTIRLKENNTRLQFEDTSAAGFPLNNWQIRANSSGAGGASFLAFVDQGAAGNSETGTILFEVDAGAPANSIKVSSNGKVGFRTPTPVLDLHMNTSDTPAVRYEQNNSGGFAAQTWDVAGNEANFFVRDVASGSRLPFRIRPGAPTSSVDISASGSVGVGTASPGFALDVQQNSSNNATGTVLRLKGNLAGNNDNTQIRFTGKTNGDIFTIGTDISTNNGSRVFQIFDLVAGSSRMTVDASGNVGIATTVPTDTLSVNGTASKPGGGSWALFSDERLKNIKGNYTTGLSAVMRLQPLRYQYKPDNALGLKFDRENVGVGAEALQKVITEAVTRSENGYLMVNNDPILWTMLNAIKEQQEQIEKLKPEVQQLRALANKPQN